MRKACVARPRGRHVWSGYWWVETNASGELSQEINRPPVFWAVDHFSRPLPINVFGQMLMFAGRPFPIAVEVLWKRLARAGSQYSLYASRQPAIQAGPTQCAICCA